MKAHVKRATLALTVLELIYTVAVIIVIARSLREQMESGSTTEPSALTTSGGENDTSFDVLGTNDTLPEEMTPMINGKVHAYYIMTIVVLLFVAAPSVVLFMALAKEKKSLVRTHLDMTLPLSLLSLVLFIILLVEGTPHKAVKGLLGFYHLIRVIVYVVEHCHHGDITIPVQTVSVRFKRADRLRTSGEPTVDQTVVI